MRLSPTKVTDVSEVAVKRWDFDSSLPRVYLTIGGQSAVAHFRTEADGGQRPKEAVQDGAFPIWQWDGDRDEPTLSPSLQIWDAHFHIQGGEVVPADNQTTTPSDAPDDRTGDF
jgi:hypothetical protein